MIEEYQVMRGVVKVPKSSKNSVGIGNGAGKLAWISMEKIKESFPINLEKWQETLFLLPRNYIIKWVEENLSYYHDNLDYLRNIYKKNIITLPEPIPPAFKIESNSVNNMPVLKPVSELIVKKNDNYTQDTQILERIKNIERKLDLIYSAICPYEAPDGTIVPVFVAEKNDSNKEQQKKLDTDKETDDDIGLGW